MECGYYPHVKQDWKSRVKVCWQILWYGELLPRPVSWYEPLFNMTGSRLSLCVKRAVEKVEREHKQSPVNQHERLLEARQWAQVYIKEADLYSSGMRQDQVNFLIEWWILRIGGSL